MAAATPAVGIAHVTVVPTNHVPRGADEEDDQSTDDATAAGLRCRS